MPSSFPVQASAPQSRTPQPTTPQPRTPQPRHPEGAPVRERILVGFEQRAQELGIRAVVMADLAHDLGISTRTLYREFHSKDELVHCLLDRWTASLRADQEQRTREFVDPVDRIEAASRSLVRARKQFCQQFWLDLASDHPDSSAAFFATIEDMRSRAHGWIRPLLRPELDRALVSALFSSLVRIAADPNFADGLGLDPEEVAAQCVRIWAGGALTPTSDRSPSGPSGHNPHLTPPIGANS